MPATGCIFFGIWIWLAGGVHPAPPWSRPRWELEPQRLSALHEPRRASGGHRHVARRMALDEAAGGSFPRSAGAWARRPARPLDDAPEDGRALVAAHRYRRELAPSTMGRRSHRAGRRHRQRVRGNATRPRPGPRTACAGRAGAATRRPTRNNCRGGGRRFSAAARGCRRRRPPSAGHSDIT